MSEQTDVTRRDGGTRRRPEGGLADVPPELNALTEKIIGAAIEVHRNLGPGLLEKLYVQALRYELEKLNLDVKHEHPIIIEYKTIQLMGQRLDLLVNDRVVIEAKAVERVHDVHLAQLVSYLRSGRYPLGLLINFNVPLLKDGLYRRVNLNIPTSSSSTSSGLTYPDSSTSSSSPFSPASDLSNSHSSSSPRPSAPSAFKSSSSPEVPS